MVHLTPVHLGVNSVPKVLATLISKPLLLELYQALEMCRNFFHLQIQIQTFYQVDFDSVLINSCAFTSAEHVVLSRLCSFFVIPNGPFPLIYRPNRCNLNSVASAWRFVFKNLSSFMKSVHGIFLDYSSSFNLVLLPHKPESFGCPISIGLDEPN